jgi:hypothetical protein
VICGFAHFSDPLNGTLSDFGIGRRSEFRVGPSWDVDFLVDRWEETDMSMQGPGGAGGRDPGAQRWGAEKEQIDKQAREEHLVHEAERIHAEEAAEEAAVRGEAPKPNRPWWKFWA